MDDRDDVDELLGKAGLMSRNSRTASTLAEALPDVHGATDMAPEPWPDETAEDVLDEWAAAPEGSETADHLDLQLVESPQLRALALKRAQLGEDPPFEWPQQPRRLPRYVPALVAAAAVVVLSVGARTWSSSSESFAPYDVARVEGGVAGLRGEEAPVRTFAPSTEVVIHLRPGTRQAAPTVRVCMGRPSGPYRPTKALRVEQADGGGLILRSRAESLFEAPGAWRIMVGLGDARCSDTSPLQSPGDPGRPLDQQWIAIDAEYRGEAKR